MSISPGDRSVLVTGAADGIGRGIATIFARAGDRVALLTTTPTSWPRRPKRSKQVEPKR